MRSVFPDVSVSNVPSGHTTKSSEENYDKEKEEIYVCRVAGHIEPPYTQTEVSFRWYGQGLQPMETAYPKIGELKCLVATMGKMEIFPVMPFYVYIANLLVEAVSLPKGHDNRICIQRPRTHHT